MKISVSILEMPDQPVKAFLLAILIGLPFFKSQSQNVLPLYISSNLQKISSAPTVIRIKNDGIKIPAGGHLQGIQQLNDSLLIITGSSSSIAYYLVVNINSCKIISINKIDESPFKHAGGCQLLGNMLAVGIEDNAAKNRSHLNLITFNASGKQIANNAVVYRQGVYKRSTAGAVGITRDISGKLILIAGDWDSRYFDMYQNKGGATNSFDSITTFATVNKLQLPAYQAVNLVTDTTGRLFMLGFSLYKGKNQLDIDKLTMQNNTAVISVEQRINFHCRYGASFRYAAGIGITANKHLRVYACSRSAARGLVINIFSANH
jgi:hypothetical protein